MAPLSLQGVRRLGPGAGNRVAPPADAVEHSWPELGEELARKSLDTLIAAVCKHTDGELNDRELMIVVNTITDTTMGLIPMDVTETIYAVRKGLEA
jgi:hypothetical protein